jgi:hypothetical protein
MISKPEDLLFHAHQVLGRVVEATVSPKTGWEFDRLSATPLVASIPSIFLAGLIGGFLSSGSPMNMHALAGVPEKS